MLLEHEQKYGLGMDALVSGCSLNTNGVMVWAWMLWASARGARALGAGGAKLLACGDLMFAPLAP